MIADSKPAPYGSAAQVLTDSASSSSMKLASSGELAMDMAV